MASKFVKQVTEGSHCGKCMTGLTLLCKRNGFAPAFYICWDCKKVFEVGSGEVLED